MPITYPTTLDSLSNPAPTDPRSAPDHAAQHSDENDAAKAIETELGTLPKGAFASVKALLDANCEWDAEIVKAADDTYTNNIALNNDSELFFNVDASAIYLVEFDILYSGSSTAADWKFQFVYPTLSLARQAQGWYLGLNTSDSLVFSSWIGTTTQWPTGAGAGAQGTDASNSKFLISGVFTLATNGSGVCHFAAGQVNTSGSPSKTLIGSRLRYKKLA